MADPKKSQVGRPGRPQAAADKGRSRLGDSTRPIAIDRRLTTSRRSSRFLMFATSTVALALGASLFVAPLQKYLQQDQTLESHSEQLVRLRNVNADLEDEVKRLDTTAGVQEAAREEIGLQNPGEETITILDPKAVPTDLPSGWPYNLVTKISATKRSGS